MEFLIGILMALWLGVLTSVSPCPLATNILAISFVARRMGDTTRVLMAGFLYTAGRALAYVVVGFLISYGLMSTPAVSQFLQKYMNKILGPVLVVAGMFMVDLIRFAGKGAGLSDSMQKRVESSGIWGAALLGIVFALSFCPISAALFFGSLVPLAVKFHSGILMPLLYGFGTAVPVVVLAVILAVSAGSFGKAFETIGKLEWWARRITGVLFILVGIYYCITYVYGIRIFK